MGERGWRGMELEGTAELFFSFDRKGEAWGKVRAERMVKDSEMHRARLVSEPGWVANVDLITPLLIKVVPREERILH